MELLVTLIALFMSVSCDNFNLPAYEYIRRFNQSLHLGQCANQIVQFPDGPVPLQCKYDPREGKTYSRDKEVKMQMIYPIRDANELIHLVGLCDDRAAAYFGLLAGKDECIVELKMANGKDNSSEALMPVAMATFIQSGWFFGASILQRYVKSLPKDPLIMIGAVYALAGADILIYRYYKNRTAGKSE